jgi:spore germination cell wall hydrolase CwlJ-like protein
LPRQTGYQDLGSLLARQPDVAERWQKRVIASAASSIQVATFSFSRPIGTAMPESANIRLASLGHQGIDPISTPSSNPAARVAPRYDSSEFPKVDRTLKGDRLALVPAQQPSLPGTDSFKTNSSVMGAKTTAAPVESNEKLPLDPELAAALDAPPLSSLDAPQSADAHDVDPLNETSAPLEGVAAGTAPVPTRESFSIQTGNLFFGSSSLGASLESMERWQPGEEPTIVGLDPDLKASVAPAQSAPSGESVASKGEVNVESQRARTPAERLGLFDPKARAKQEKCLADAVYFEARGEAVRGQIAVAQVVMNRVFSGYYPSTPCGVVYQNANRHLSCQFTFACDGIRDVVNEPDMWDRARRIAKETLDGRLWLPEVAKSTHYHAYWVHPSWVREMKRNYKFGVHSFYRPRKWGDGSDAPSWGTQAATAEISATLTAHKP